MLSGGAANGNVSVIVAAVRAGASTLKSIESRVDRRPVTPLFRAVQGRHLAATAVLLLQSERELANMTPAKYAKVVTDGNDLLGGWSVSDPSSTVYAVYIDDNGESAGEESFEPEHRTGELLRAMLTFPWNTFDTAINTLYVMFVKTGT